MPQSNRILRLALAMRGGVSLAVWIGGAIAELDLFRRALTIDLQALDPARRERVKSYQKLLTRNHFDRVDIDILAGASAGGLNAVLLGVAQSYGVAIDSPVHRTWIQEAGIWDLIRGPGWGRVDSVLRGDDRLLKVAHMALQTVTAETPVSDPVDNITVELSATLLNDGQNPQIGNMAGLTFARRAGLLESKFSTIPQANDPATDRERALRLLALAARSTSSFPGAFEPASVLSLPDKVPGVVDNAVGAFAQLVPVTPDGVVPPAKFKIVDGGIFDNIPIDRAIRAIQRAPSAKPSERRLVYLDPSPPSPVTPLALPGAFDSSWLATILKSLGLKQRTESAQDELALVREHNDEVLALRARMEGFSASIPDREALPGISNRAYVECRVGLDAKRFGRVLIEPWKELCVPPWPAASFNAMSQSEALEVKSAVRRAYDPDEAVIAITSCGDIEALLDGIKLLIAWVQELERATRLAAPAWDGRATLTGVKGGLYRCLTIGTEARRKCVYRFLASPVLPGQEFDLVDRIQQTWAEQTTLTVPQALLASLGTRANGDEDTVNEIIFYEDLGGWVTGPVNSDDRNFLSSMWDVLTDARAELIAQGQPVGIGAEALDNWNDSVFPHLYVDQPPTEPEHSQVFQAVKSLSATGIPGTASIIAFDTITGREHPRVLVEELSFATRRRQLEAWLRKPPAFVDLDGAPYAPEVESAVVYRNRESVDVKAKLAGTQLSNFGGFLDWRWRASDWRWGRLDAAAGIVEMVNRAGSAGRPASESPPDGAENMITNLQTSILSLPENFYKDGNENHNWAADPTDFAISDISPRYRFSLVSRLVPVALRAAWPGPEDRWKVLGWLRRILLLLVRMLSVPLTLLADPLRIVFAFSLVVGGTAVAGTSSSGTSARAVFGALLLGTALLAAFSSVGSARRWKHIDRVLEAGVGRNTQYIDWSRDVKVARRRCMKFWWGQAGVFAVAVGLGGLLVASAWEPRLIHHIPVEGLIALTAAAFGTHLWLSLRAKKMPVSSAGGIDKSQRTWRGVGYIVAVAILATAIWGSHHRNILGLDGPVASLAVSLIAGGVAAGLVFFSTAGWTKHWMISVVVGAAWVVGGLAMWGLEFAGLSIKILLSLLPAVLWLVGLGVFIGCLPVRSHHYGEVQVAPPN